MADFLMPHGRGWRYIRAVPRDLHDIVGRKFWTKCLGAVPYDKAKAVALAKAAADQKMIDALRRLGGTERAAILSSGGLDKWHLQHAAERFGVPFLKLAADLKPDDDEPEEMQAMTALSAYKAQQELERIAGNTRVATKLATPGKAGALLKLVDLYVEVKRPRNPKTVGRVRRIFGQFIRVCGDLAPAAVTRSHVIAFRDHMEGESTFGVVVEALRALHAVFAVAVSEGAIPANPASGVKARPGTAKLSDGRKEFSVDQIRRIIAALEGEDDDFQWITKLLIFHGARTGEICQLRCDDIAEVSGLPVVRIHDRHGSVKNKFSIRDVPIHPRCLGIVDYAKRIAREHGSDSWLFVSLTQPKQGRAEGYSQYANSTFLRRKVGIVEKVPGRRQYNQTTHSLRHSFRTQCREIGMPLDVSSSLMGHSLGNGEHAAYGAVPSLKLRAEWIARIDPLKG